MMEINTTIDSELYNAIKKISDKKLDAEVIFDCCESQEDRARMLYYIRNVKDDMPSVLLMAAQIGIENGTVEGEFEEE